MDNLATVILCIILGLICVYSVFSYIKRLNSGCCGSGGGEIKITPSDKNKKNYPYSALLYIDGMTCNHCKMRVENAFNKNDGVYATVKLKEKCAEVLSKEPLDEAFFKDTVERAGYKLNHCK